MSEEIDEKRNFLVGTLAAFIEGIILQPTLYWKNARSQGLPFTMNPRVIYRGTTVSVLNECQLMGIQFSATSYARSLISHSHGNRCIDKPDTPSSKQQERYEMLLSSAIGGIVSALAACPAELIMIQQQLHGKSIFHTPKRIIQNHSIFGLTRGLTAALARDMIFTVGMLGLTPILQNYMHQELKIGLETAGFYASVLGGGVASLVSNPFDVIKTNMQGDISQKKFTTFSNTALTLYRQGGFIRFYHGAGWRAVNLIGTIYIANLCRVHLPSLLFNVEDSNGKK